MQISGEFFIGARATTTDEKFSAYDPSKGESIGPEFSSAGPAHVEAACALAEAAFGAYRESGIEARAAFLERIADNIMDAGDALIERGMAETGLPQARLQGERGRTIGQLRLFAEVVRKGDWLGARLDSALPDRAPLPRPDIRLRKVPLGPVAIFGASNFPLAFSVAGGDTAAALAAGCPVVFKGHSAHPGLSAMVARAVLAAAESCGMPDGVFSLLMGNNRALGAGLVADHRIMAAAFTGSRAGGLALQNIAQARQVPIPVYAEMSSINPVVLLPQALAARADALGPAFVASLTMGAGQFCTNPGLVVALKGEALDRFAQAAAAALKASAPQVMLTQRIHQAYVEGVEKLASHANVDALVAGGAAPDSGPHCGAGALFQASARDFLAGDCLSDEVFGAAGLIVQCDSEDELAAVLGGLEGQLTASLHMDEGDHGLARRLLPILETKAGRIIANGWPTGVEVCHAMVHGGPFPATSDTRTTSVGTLAIDRFLRPVSYQAMPDALLPEALRSDNPLKLRRLVDGNWN